MRLFIMPGKSCRGKRIRFSSYHGVSQLLSSLSVQQMNPLSVERKYVRRTPFLDRISGKRSPFKRSSLFRALKGGVHSKSGAYLIYSTFVRNSKELFIQSIYGFSAFLNLIESNTSVFPVHHHIISQIIILCINCKLSQQLFLAFIYYFVFPQKSRIPSNRWRQF